MYLAPNYRYQKLLTLNHEEPSEATVISNSIAVNLGYQLTLKDIVVMEIWVGTGYFFRKVVDETVPGAWIGFIPEDEFVGVARAGIAIGVLF